MKLRNYQAEAIYEITKSMEQHQRVLAVMPTGVGKTVVFCHLAKQMLDRGRVMIMAHRNELITQAYHKARTITGMIPDIEKADQWAADAFPAEVVVTSVQTQIAGMGGKGRMTRFDPGEFALVVVDEAHHAVTPSYRRVIDYYAQNPNCKILGVTATPNRADEKALGTVFEACAYEYGLRDAIDDGWLVPIHQEYVVVDSLDLSMCHVTADGDLNGRDLEEAVAKMEVVMGCVPKLLELTGRTLVFTASVLHAKMVAAALNAQKPDSAAVVCDKTPKDERPAIFEAFHDGSLQYICNVGITTEGYDEPLVEHVAVLRPTKSMPLYQQMIGRGTRPLPGVVDRYDDPALRRQAIADSDKPRVHVIDFVGNSGRHKLISTVDVLGGRYDEDVLDVAREMARKEPGEKPTESLLEAAEAELARRRREQLRIQAARQAKIKAAYKTYTVNPFDVFEITPWRERVWDKHEDATPKQCEMLRRNGIDPAGMTKRQARQIITEIIKRRERGLCTFKQARILRSRGYETDVTKDEASRIIDEIAKRENWRVRKHTKRTHGVAG